MGLSSIQVPSPERRLTGKEEVMKCTTIVLDGSRQELLEKLKTFRDCRITEEVADDVLGLGGHTEITVQGEVNPPNLMKKTGREWHIIYRDM